MMSIRVVRMVTPHEEWIEIGDDPDLEMSPELALEVFIALGSVLGYEVEE